MCVHNKLIRRSINTHDAGSSSRRGGQRLALGDARRHVPFKFVLRQQHELQLGTLREGLGKEAAQPVVVQIQHRQIAALLIYFHLEGAYDVRRSVSWLVSRNRERENSQSQNESLAHTLSLSLSLSLSLPLSLSLFLTHPDVGR